MTGLSEAERVVPLGRTEFVLGESWVDKGFQCITRLVYDPGPCPADDTPHMGCVNPAHPVIWGDPGDAEGVAPPREYTETR